MSAICGVWHLDGRPGAAGDCARMQRALAVYGRDRQERWTGDAIALGVQLARLLPEDVHDRQPLTGGAGRFALVADVRLDNRPELAALLSLTSAQTRTMADADFVLAAWERWQEASIDRLCGEFALALWDRAERRLYLARDPLGHRPLFYHRSAGRVAFATMAKGLHALPDVPVAPDFDTLREYLALAPQRGPGSFFAGIDRVEPGGLITISADGRTTATAWYQWRLDRELQLRDDREYVDAFRSVFERAVADRLRCTGTVASQLSSGRDSSLVTSTAAGLLAQQGRRLTAYTHVPLRGVPLEARRGRIVDEWPLAAAQARRLANVEHLAVEAPDRLIGDDLDAYLDAVEYPPLDLCNHLWSSAIARQAAARGQTLLLTGSLGNATVSQVGNERLFELFAAGRFTAWSRELMALARTGRSAAGLAYGSVGPLLPHGLVRFLQRITRREVPDWTQLSPLHPEILADAAFHRRLRALGADAAAGRATSIRATAAFVLRRLDVWGVIGKGFLAAFGVERRDPTSDRRLYEFTLSLPSHVFLRHGRSRWLYRAAFADRLGPEILDEQRKGYQAADWAERLRRSHSSVSAHLRSAGRSAGVGRLIDVRALTDLIEAPLPTGAGTAAQAATYRFKLLRGVSVARFVSRLDARSRTVADEQAVAGPARLAHD